MSIREKPCRPFRIEKDLKTHLMQSLEKSDVLTRVCPEEFNTELQYQATQDGDDNEEESCSQLKASYPPTLDSKGLQFPMAASCQEIQPDSDYQSQSSVLSHKQLVESLDRLSSPPPSQLNWIQANEDAGQMQYDQDPSDDPYSNDIQEADSWSRCQLEGNNINEDQQQVADFLTQIENTLHDHIDDELAMLRANLHGLVADQQQHLQRFLTPPQFSQDVTDVEIISNPTDFQQRTNINLEDTGWSSDCMQSSCSTINEPMKLEEASPEDPVVVAQEDMACQQLESANIINDRLTEENEIQNVFIALQTLAATLSHTLRRQEYSTS